MSGWQTIARHDAALAQLNRLRVSGHFAQSLKRKVDGDGQGASRKLAGTADTDACRPDPGLDDFGRCANKGLERRGADFLAQLGGQRRQVAEGHTFAVVQPANVERVGGCPAQW